MEKVTQNIRKFRELKNYTQSYMAEKLDLSQSHYQRLESGDTKADGNIIDQIAEILGVNRELLYTFDEKIIFQGNVQAAQSINNSGEVNFYPIDSKLEQLFINKGTTKA